MVRRACASHLGNLAATMKPAIVESDLLPLYRNFLNDDQEPVRVNALLCSAALSQHIEGASKLALLQESFAGCTREKSWRVRMACAEVSAELAASCTSDTQALRACEEIYTALQEDMESEVRVAAALRGAGVASALGSSFARETVFPVVSKLVHDTNCTSRVELAAVMVELAVPMGRDGALELILPAMVLLTEDESTNLRLTVINKLTLFIEVVGLSQEDALLPVICRLGEDKNWRVRHKILQLLPAFARELGPQAFWQSFQNIVKDCVKDDCHLVREDWVTSMGDVSSLPGFGTRWLEENILPIALLMIEEKSYQLRSVILSTLRVLGPILSTNALETMLLPPALSMADDKVPNLRLLAAHALGAVAPHVSAAFNREKILPKLQTLCADGDIDVKFASGAAMDALGDITTA